MLARTLCAILGHSWQKPVRGRRADGSATLVRQCGRCEVHSHLREVQKNFR